MSKEIEIEGLKIFLSKDAYNEYKGALNEQVKELQNKINEAIDFIETEAIVEELEADHTYITINKDKLLEILGVEQNESI